jgi:hypothetical protein
VCDFAGCLLLGASCEAIGRQHLGLWSLKAWWAVQMESCLDPENCTGLGAGALEGLPGLMD